MNIFELNQKLKKAAELQSEFPPDDALTKLIRSCAGEELSQDDLEWVSAAGKGPDYSEFLKLLREREGK